MSKSAELFEAKPQRSRRLRRFLCQMFVVIMDVKMGDVGTRLWVLLPEPSVLLWFRSVGPMTSPHFSLVLT